MLEIPRKPALHGEELKAAMLSCEALPPWLVTHLLAKDASFMICSDGSVGKSLMTLNAAAAMSAGLPVWGHFPVPRPLRILFLVGERTVNEALRRLKRFAAVYPLNVENFWITDAFAGSCNLLLDKDVEGLIKRIEADCPNGIDVIFMDPLYPFVAGALSEDSVGNRLTRTFTRLKAHFNCTLWVTHHNVKERVASDGRMVRSSNPFYGSVWLYNHVTTQYTAERESGDRTILRIQKDNWACQLPLIPLIYNPDNEAITMDCATSPQTKADALHLFLRARQADGTPFTRSDIVTATGISVTQLYRILAEPPWAATVKNISANGKAAVYRVTQAST